MFKIEKCFKTDYHKPFLKSQLRNRSAQAVNCYVIIHCLEVNVK